MGNSNNLCWKYAFKKIGPGNAEPLDIITIFSVATSFPPPSASQLPAWSADLAY